MRQTVNLSEGESLRHAAQGDLDRPLGLAELHPPGRAQHGDATQRGFRVEVGGLRRRPPADTAGRR